ncbi:MULTISPECIES: hypothetical protein [Streptomyces]|uniref:hypothetical protein n=1 Tax=Streptomyces TaxID=1883 RepID=UPI00099E07CD|nr:MULTISPECIES: hypothetical protein [Streptomyces]
MRHVSGDSNAVLPWQVVRQDANGNRYRVGSYATRAEALHLAERLGGRGAGATGADDGTGAAPGDDYLVEHLEHLESAYGGESGHGR